MQPRTVPFMYTIKHLPADPRAITANRPRGAMSPPEESRYFMDMVTLKLQVEAMRRRAPAPRPIPLPTPAQGPLSVRQVPAYRALARAELGLGGRAPRPVPDSLLVRTWRCVVRMVAWLKGA